MRYLLKFRFPVDTGNTAVADPEFGHKMQALLSEIGAEAAYFTSMSGQRGGYVVVNMDDASQIPAIAEPFFMWLKADVEFLPVMRPEDLAKAAPAIATSKARWGRSA